MSLSFTCLYYVISMDVLVLGAGLMGRAIAFDLVHNTCFENVNVLDMHKKCLEETKRIFQDNNRIEFLYQDVTNKIKMKSLFADTDVIISAVPYSFNINLTKLAISQKCHFVDLGGNNTVVQNQKELNPQAKQNHVTIIPDSGLAPGLVSILTKNLVDEYGHFSSVKLRVGGLPRYPKEPWKYQLVFSANGLINEYAEDAIVLDHGTIKKVPSLTECESIEFSEPFGMLEAFITSGGSSTLPYSYKETIDCLDYKTIRYPGHLQQVKPLFDIDLHKVDEVNIHGCNVVPRDVLIYLLNKILPEKGEDVVLLRVTGEQREREAIKLITFEMIDYYDKETRLSAMMRTTGFPVSITADLIATNKIEKNGVFTPEEIIPSDIFLHELRKRDITINKKVEIYEEVM